MNLKKKVLVFSLSGIIAFGGSTGISIPVNAVGEGPDPGNGSVQTSILHTYESMVDYLKTQDSKQGAMELEVIGKTVKGRDIYLAKYNSNPKNPTILFLTQQHGNEQLTTEGHSNLLSTLAQTKPRVFSIK